MKKINIDIKDLKVGDVIFYSPPELYRELIGVVNEIKDEGVHLKLVYNRWLDKVTSTIAVLPKNNKSFFSINKRWGLDSETSPLFYGNEEVIKTVKAFLFNNR